MQNWSPSLDSETGPNRFPRARLRNIRWIKPEEATDPADVHPLRAPIRFGFKGVPTIPSTVVINFAEKLLASTKFCEDDLRNVYKEPNMVYAFVHDQALTALSGLEYGDHFSVVVITQHGDYATLNYELTQGDFHAAIGLSDKARHDLAFGNSFHSPRLDLSDRSLTGLALGEAAVQARLDLSDKGRQTGATSPGENRPLAYLADKATNLIGQAGETHRPIVIANDKVQLNATTGDGLNLQVLITQTVSDKATQAEDLAGTEYFQKYILVVLGDKASELVGVGLPSIVLSEIADKAVNRLLTGAGLFEATILPVITNWADQVVANGGARPSEKTQLALSRFYQGLIDNGLLSKVKVFNAFALDNLTAALTPLIVGPGSVLWANTNFVNGDLSTTGLKGNGTDKCLNAGFKMSQIWSETDAGCLLYASEDADETAVLTGAVDVAGNSGNGYWRLAAHQSAPNGGMLVSMFNDDTNSGLTGRWTSNNYGADVMAAVEVIGSNIDTFHASTLEPFDTAGSSTTVLGTVPTKADCYVFCSNEGDITI